jgi:hypothetical protein
MADNFEIYLGLYARWNGIEPTKPPSPRAIAQLAFKLERAEQLLDDPYDTDEDTARSRFRDAVIAYTAAINARDLYARVKFIRRKATYSRTTLRELKDATYQPRYDSDVLHDLGGKFSSRRERIDADLAASQAEDFYDIAIAKFQSAEREARADKRNGIVRTLTNPHIIRL